MHPSAGLRRISRSSTALFKQAYRTKGALTVQPPKTDNSMRKIALSAETMELLKQEHDKHPDNPYLFPVAVPGVFFARRSGLESRRPLPLAPLPSSAPGGGRVAPPRR